MKNVIVENEITYKLGADGIYYPDIALPEDEAPHYGKYGYLRLRYLEEELPFVLDQFVLEGKLIAHLNEIDDTASEQVDLVTRQPANQQGVTEDLKCRNPHEWVGAMNNCRSAAEEIVLKDLIYT